MKIPLLYLGLIGFDHAAEVAIQNFLLTQASIRQADAESTDARPCWKIVDVKAADAVLIRGASISSVNGSFLQLMPALQNSHPSLPLGIDLAHMTMPHAFSDPLHLTTLGLALGECPIYNPDQLDTLVHTLTHFESILLTLRSLYAIAAELTERRAEFDSNHTYHLEQNGGLDAIIDLPKRRVLLRPGVQPIRISSDAWLCRPRSANFAPSHFVECSLVEVGWIYAQRCPQIKLPKRYLQKSIHILHNPRVRSSLLHSRHTVLVDALWQSAQTIDELCALHPQLSSWIKRDLYAMYLTRCISTHPASQQSDDASPASNTFTPSHSMRFKRSHTVTDQLQTLY
jgi:hypothetical protein